MILASSIILAALFAPVNTTVEEMKAAPSDFHGKEVVIEGWVMRCQGYDCAIRDHRDMDAPSLSIASGTIFDTVVGAQAPVRVKLTATVDATCFSGEFVCTDRPPELTPKKWKVKY
ncbi:hypothetical protein [Sphingomicrobium marinum]|uniref:hypothetical protein n=1 Tax=Sphingomicrobium marinum TaxID=1227950 RepID=UPI00223EBF3A|nr:hypothetical protein [Sphingomicrobium marinum]